MTVLLRFTDPSTLCVHLGARPQWEENYYLTPVHYVSKAIVALSLQAVNQNHVFYEELKQAVQQSQDNALTPLLPLFLTESAETDRRNLLDPGSGVQSPRFDCTSTAAALAQLGISCPQMDDEQLGIYFSYFVEGGFLEAPSDYAMNNSVTEILGPADIEGVGEIA